MIIVLTNFGVALSYNVNVSISYVLTSNFVCGTLNYNIHMGLLKGPIFQPTIQMCTT